MGLSTNPDCFCSCHSHEVIRSVGIMKERPGKNDPSLQKDEEMLCVWGHGGT